MKRLSVFLLFAAPLLAEQPKPVIDMHLHALGVADQGPPPLAMCTPMTMPVWDPQEPYADVFFGWMKQPTCDDPIWSPETDQALFDRTIAVMRANNVYGVLSGPADRVARWDEAAPGRFLRGLGFRIHDEAPSPERLVEMHAAGELAVLAEVTTQYQGIEPTDPRLAPYWAALEQHDIPVGIHVGTGPPGVIYMGAPGYRARMHSALTLEEVLVKHPKLRVYVMHAGFPLLDDMLVVLYSHPQVYVEIGVIVYTQTREAFYAYLKGIIDAGFGKRVMFGSDQMVWPETIERSIRVIEEAPFLSAEQKRDVLFDNAARFLRLSEAEVARMHAGPADGR